MLDGKTVLITGGTGSFGKKFTEVILKRYKLKKLIIFSRDEFKQYEMAKIFPDGPYPIRYFLGDIRDKDRLKRAFDGVDYVVHAAALKHVPALEYNPNEAVKTNVVGADNIVSAAIDRGVKKVIALSTDKAVNPINLYGASKLVAEKIFIAANAYAGGSVKFSIVRYGNVFASRGSIVPLLLKLKKQGVKEFPITDERMTRFWITLQHAVEFVINVLADAEGAEVFVPKIPSMNILDLARAVDPECKFKTIGIRPGEKLHETLISEDESRKVKAYNGMYVMLPHFFETVDVHKKYEKYQPVPEDFLYRSDNNEEWISTEELRKMIMELGL